MRSTLPWVAVLGLAAWASARAAGLPGFSPEEYEQLKAERAKAWEKEGLPVFASVQEAVKFATDERNLLAHLRSAGGSERFDVPLPSGKSVSNWLLYAYFFRVFKPFGKEAVGALIRLLNHDAPFVRLGAQRALWTCAGRNDHTSTWNDDEPARLKVLQRWQAWYDKVKDNPRWYKTGEFNARMVDGKLHTTAMHWFNTGLCYETECVDHKPNGRCRAWNENGELVADGIYRDRQRWDGTFLGEAGANDYVVTTCKEGVRQPGEQKVWVGTDW
jgi:hypothetical protein